MIVLLPGGKEAFITINSRVNMEEDNNQALFDMLNEHHEKEYCFPCRSLDWVSFFPMGELSVIGERFVRSDGGF